MEQQQQQQKKQEKNKNKTVKIPILSFDVGEINLSLCLSLYDKNTNSFEIRKWFTANIYNCSHCDKELDYNNGSIKCTDETCIQQQIKDNLYQSPEQCQKAVQPHMKTLQYLSYFLKQHFDGFKLEEFQVVIEDQPYKRFINRKMVFIQDFIVSFFIQRLSKVTCMQAKERSIFYANGEYSSNKKNSVKNSIQILERCNVKEYIDYFKSNSKKDDLSDCFLQMFCYTINCVLNLNRKKEKEQKIQEFIQSIKLI